MIEIVITILSLLISEGEARGLMRTHPDLTVAVARRHLLAADAAQFATGVDSNLLLSIAWHESRYQEDAETKESGNRVSCGPMTPTPVSSCVRETIVSGYIKGALHLREWLRSTPDLRTALMGYAGGYRMISACAAGPVIRRGRGDDLCRTPDVFMARMRWIRRERALSAHATS
jgi:hypothetical protein